MARGVQFIGTFIDDLIGMNSTVALFFDDPDNAKDILQTLEANENIMVAALYDAAEFVGEALEIPGFFQEYISKAAIAESMEVPRRAGTVRQEYTSDNKHLVIVKEIEGSDGVVIGSILIKADTKQIEKIGNLFVGLITLYIVLVIVFLMTWFFKNRMGKSNR